MGEITAATSKRAGHAQEIRIRDHVVLADEPASKGGTDTGPTPQELVLAALVSCVALTLQVYANYKKIELGEVHIEAIRDDNFVELTINLYDADLYPILPKLLLVAEKCPVSKALSYHIDKKICLHGLDGQIFYPN